MSQRVFSGKDILISVIIAVYNTQDYIRKCVGSVLDQTYKCFEIILVDDGSTDASPEICDELARDYDQIRVIHQTNGGVSTARNSGINAALGEYLTFLDSDDELCENALELLLSDALKYDADVVSAVKSMVDNDGIVYDTYGNGELSIYKGEEPIVLSLEYDRQTNSACAKLFSRAFLGDVRFADGRNINEDGFFIFECYAKCPVLVQHNISIYRYFIRSASSSRKGFSESFFDMLYFCEEKKKIIKADFPHLEPPLLTMEVSTHLFFLEALCRTNDKKYRSDEKKSKKVVRDNYARFKPHNKHEKAMARIVRYHLYPLYKMMIRIRFKY